MHDVVSYSLFGVDDRYWDTLRGVVWAHHFLFPGWQLRIYHDDSVHRGSAALKRYARAGLVHAINCGAMPTVGVGTLWRFMPVWDPFCRFVLTRDIDSLPSARERSMVDEFMASGMLAHAVSDHPSHSWEMQAGMVGFLAPRARPLLPWAQVRELIQETTLKTCDQQWLRAAIWPRVKDRVCEHRLKGAPFYGHGLKFDRVKEESLAGVAPEVQKSFGRFVPFMGHTGVKNYGEMMELFKAYGHADVVRRLEAAEDLP